MEPTHHVTRILHDEHVAALGMLSRLAGLLAQTGHETPPAADVPGLSTTLTGMATAIDGEITGHFAFEEEQLFPRLAEVGDGDIGVFLAEEHEIILPLGQRLSQLARDAAESGFNAEAWQEFHRLGGEFVERLTGHIQKEEIGLAAAVDAMLDDETDSALAMAYLADR
jgi:iron-sulfur cluster repair protein YtfE (RIC family)